jgi:hypothetical protein
MPELEREEIILQRFEEVQRIRDMRNLDQMLKVQRGGEGDSSAEAAKRTFPNVFHGLHLDRIYRAAPWPRCD